MFSKRKWNESEVIDCLARRSDCGEGGGKDDGRGGEFDLNNVMLATEVVHFVYSVFRSSDVMEHIVE